MPDVVLSQDEADALLAMEKRRADDEHYAFPSAGGRVSVPLISLDGRERFLLDVNRGRIDLKKVTYQNRVYSVVILARLDVSGPTHRNPDGTEIPPPHLHLYREGFGDKWAVPAPLERFTNVDDMVHTLQQFMTFCNVTEAPHWRIGLSV